MENLKADLGKLRNVHRDKDDKDPSLEGQEQAVFQEIFDYV